MGNLQPAKPYKGTSHLDRQKSLVHSMGAQIQKFIKVWIATNLLKQYSATVQTTVLHAEFMALPVDTVSIFMYILQSEAMGTSTEMLLAMA